MSVEKICIICSIFYNVEIAALEIFKKTYLTELDLSDHIIVDWQIFCHEIII